MKIEHDFHIHTYLSSCAQPSATLEHYINKAKELGLKKIGFSDHMWDPSIDGAIAWYQKQSYEHILKLKEEIANIDSQGIEIYFGCETEYDLLHNDIGVSKDIAKELDFLLVPNSHTHITMPKDLYLPYEKHATYMLKAFYDIMNSKAVEYITAIAHPFYAVCCPYDNREPFRFITDAQFEDCFKTAKEKNVALEINVSSFKKNSLAEIYADPSLRMYQIAKECGCKFIIGSDSHSDNGHERFELIYVLTSLLELNNDHFLDIAVDSKRN